MSVLPSPTGPCPIGTLTRHWVDHDRRDIFAGPGAGPRELMVQLWYPARPDPGAPRAAYVDDPRTLEQLALLMELPRSAFAGTGSIRTHAVRDAPVAKEQEAYPVLVFSHGRCEVREHNTFQVEELASHGYVVVTIDHPSAASGASFPDGRLVEFDARLLPPWPRYAPDDPEAALLDSVIPFLADDVHFVLRRIAALNADPEDVLGGAWILAASAVFGVSLGGVVVAEACVREPAFAAVLDDGWLRAPERPRRRAWPASMWMSRDAATMRREGRGEYDITRANGSMRAAFEGLSADGLLRPPPEGCAGALARPATGVARRPLVRGATGSDASAGSCLSRERERMPAPPSDRPAIVIVAEDDTTRMRIRETLSRWFSNDYRIVEVEASSDVIDEVSRIRDADAEVALVIAEQ